MEQFTDDKLTISYKCIVIVEADDVQLLHDLRCCEVADRQCVINLWKGLEALCLVEKHFSCGSEKTGSCVVEVRAGGQEAETVIFEWRAFEEFVSVFQSDTGKLCVRGEVVVGGELERELFGEERLEESCVELRGVGETGN